MLISIDMLTYGKNRTGHRERGKGTFLMVGKEESTIVFVIVVDHTIKMSVLHINYEIIALGGGDFTHVR